MSQAWMDQLKQLVTGLIAVGVAAAEDVPA